MSRRRDPFADARAVFEADGAPPLLLAYVEARAVLIFALRGFHRATAALREAEDAAARAFASREIRRDLEMVIRRVRSAVDAKSRRRWEQQYGITAREAEAKLRGLPTRSDELRAWVALADAVDVFNAWAAVVDDAAWVTSRRHHAWRRWEAARDLAAANFGVEVCRYVPTERKVAE